MKVIFAESGTHVFDGTVHVRSALCYVIVHRCLQQRLLGTNRLLGIEGGENGLEPVQC